MATEIFRQPVAVFVASEEHDGFADFRWQTWLRPAVLLFVVIFVVQDCGRLLVNLRLCPERFELLANQKRLTRATKRRSRLYLCWPLREPRPPCDGRRRRANYVERNAGSDRSPPPGPSGYGL